MGTTPLSKLIVLGVAQLESRCGSHAQFLPRQRGHLKSHWTTISNRAYHNDVFYSWMGGKQRERSVIYLVHLMYYQMNGACAEPAWHTKAPPPKPFY